VEVWVVSGDYKRDPDPSCEPFEVVPCGTFITEATFGTPRYVWDRNSNHGKVIHDWWLKNASEGRNSLLFGYSLGKAQRILAELAPHAAKPVLIHSSVAELTRCYRAEGRRLASAVELDCLTTETSSINLQGELILAPPSILKSEWFSRLGDFQTAFASGWMQGNSYSYSGGYDHGFVMSDHADWESLNRTIDETGARRVFVQHRSGALIRHLRQRGVEAYPESDLKPENYERIAPTNLSLFDLSSNL
jgi:putative mRNA 3-end processing factor